MKNFLNVIKRSACHTGVVLKKHSPEIMIVAGSVGAVTAAVLACRATLKATEVLKKTREDLEEIHEAREVVGVEEYTENDYRGDLVRTYVRTGVELVKLYGPAIALGSLSLATMFASNNMLRKRNASLMAAYTTIDGAFRSYRKNVIDEYGAEVDHRLRHGIKKQEIDVVEVDSKGKEKTVKKVVDVMNDDPSGYARYFDKSCVEWDEDPEYNLSFLKMQQEYCNNLLKTRKHLFLNEVYDLLGIKRTEAGQLVGWLYDEENPTGDNYVDFGIFNIHRKDNRDFVNGYENVILLDFNVDGVIANKI